MIDTKYHHQCNFSLFWYTSLACSKETLFETIQADNDGIEQHRKLFEGDECKIYVPIYNQVLDLRALKEKIGYHVPSGKDNQPNIDFLIRNVLKFYEQKLTCIIYFVIF